MELWIRSQDKRILQKVDNIYLNHQYEDKRICTYDGDDDGVELGTYATKERALEVLDEIQEAMMLNEDYNYSGRVEVNTIRKCLIYEMPKD